MLGKSSFGSNGFSGRAERLARIGDSEHRFKSSMDDHMDRPMRFNKCPPGGFGKARFGGGTRFRPNLDDDSEMGPKFSKFGSATTKPSFNRTKPCACNEKPTWGKASLKLNSSSDSDDDEKPILSTKAPMKAGWGTSGATKSSWGKCSTSWGSKVNDDSKPKFGSDSDDESSSDSDEEKIGSTWGSKNVTKKTFWGSAPDEEPKQKPSDKKQPSSNAKKTKGFRMTQKQLYAMQKQMISVMAQQQMIYMAQYQTACNMAQQMMYMQPQQQMMYMQPQQQMMYMQPQQQMMYMQPQQQMMYMQPQQQMMYMQQQQQPNYYGSMSTDSESDSSSSSSD